MEQIPLIVEHEETEQTIITDTAGESVLAAEVGSQVVVDDAGGRHFRTVKRLVRGEGQRIITDATQTYTCACGNRLLTKETVGFCEVCQFPACRQHLKGADDGATVVRVCAACFEHGKCERALLRVIRRTLRFLQWLTRI
jgi:hypothetical protein